MRKLISIALLLPAGIAAGHEFSGAQGTVTVDWSVANISRVIASGYGDSFGTEAWARKGLPEIVETDGRRCVDATYLKFDVDDDFAFDIDEDVTLELLFDRKRSGGMFISYDQNVVAENIRAIEFAASAERWHTETITLRRARFANRGESGSDFTIAAPDGTWFGDPNGEHRFVLCDLRIVRADQRRPAGDTGRIRLRVFD